MDSEFYNTRYGKISLSSLWSDARGNMAFECYDEMDKYYGTIVFGLNEVPTDDTVDKKLAAVRYGL